MSSSVIVPVTGRIAPLPPRQVQNVSAPTVASQPATASEPAASVTISDRAKQAAAASPPTQGANPSSTTAQAAQAAPTTVVSAKATVNQVLISQYVAEVRVAPPQDGGRNISQLMALVGVPEADQAEVAAALGSAP